jgi:hypothetical protein
LQANTDKYEPVFWSGFSENEFGEIIEAKERADLFCDRHNAYRDAGEPEYKTIEELMKDAGFDPADVVDWQEASKIFAEESSGQAHVFIGEKCEYEDNEWNCTERDAVIENSKIDNDIDCVDLSTGLHSTCDKKNLPNPHKEMQNPKAEPPVGEEAAETTAGAVDVAEEGFDIFSGIY